MTTSDPILLPPLLYIICMMSAMSFVVSAGLWFWRRPEEPYVRVVWRGQAQGFVWAMILSIALGQSFDIAGELVVLVIALVFGYRHIQETLIFGGLCALGWFVTISVGWALFLLSGDVMVSAFIAGLLWLVPVFGLYRLRPAEGRVYHYLWPVLLAYLVLLAPLMIQHNVNSEAWQLRKYEKPLRRA